MNQQRSRDQLSGRIALVSGGAHGIGREVAALLQREGACVFIVDCDIESGKKSAANLSAHNPALPVKCLEANLREPLGRRGTPAGS